MGSGGRCHQLHHPACPSLPTSSPPQVDELKKRSEDTKRALEVQRRQEEEQQRRLEELQAAQQSVRQHFESLAEQAEYYGQQLKLQYELYKQRQAELQDMRVGPQALEPPALSWRRCLLRASCGLPQCSTQCVIKCQCNPPSRSRMPPSSCNSSSVGRTQSPVAAPVPVPRPPRPALARPCRSSLPARRRTFWTTTGS